MVRHPDFKGVLNLTRGGAVQEESDNMRRDTTGHNQQNFNFHVINAAERVQYPHQFDLIIFLPHWPHPSYISTTGERQL